MRLQYNATYCSAQHQRKAADRRKYNRNKADRKARRALHQPAPVSDKSRRGETYAALGMRPQLVEDLIDGVVPHSYAAEVLKTSAASVSRALAAILVTRELEETAAVWTMGPLAQAMFPHAKMARLKELGPQGEDTDEFGCLLDEVVRAFDVMSRRFFTLEGARILNEEFHLRWIRLIISAWAAGAKQMILSPPRHGKSELLVRFTVWMIAMFPNIRAMWVAANKDVAQMMLGSVKDHLENNGPLIAATLPPGESYRPTRQSNRPWSQKEIKIAQQSHVGQKSSTLLALGRTAKILNRDVDLLYVDDFEDFDTTRESGQREYSRNKFAEIGTRKEESTLWLWIGSRQHPSDVAFYLLKRQDDELAWRISTDTAHADCDLDPTVLSGHDTNGCMLFPAVRSYRWLMEKKQETDALGIPGAYEMRYLNRPVPTEGIVFRIAEIRDKALNRSRGLGIDELGSGQLVAGLDPATRGTQAAFLWHYTTKSLSMVDLETQQAGGFEGAQYIMQNWYDRYDLQHWFYEDNSGQIEFFRDPRTKALQKNLGLVIKSHTTGRNKQDPGLGLTGMAPWYHDGTIDLPYGTAEAQAKVEELLRQLELWSTDGIVRNKRDKTDIKMAQWFPFPTILKWHNRDRKPTLKVLGASSYPGYDTMESMPWGETRYPGE